MKIYCVKCREKTDTDDMKKVKTKASIAIKGKCADCGTNKFSFSKGDKKGQKGNGALDYVKTILSRIAQFISGRKRGSPELMKFIGERGSETIKRIIVCRVPISRGVSSFLNILSLGTFNKITNDMSYDSMFHLFLYFETVSGGYITERNEIVRVYNGQPSGEQVELNMRGMSGNLTVGDFFRRAIERQGDKIFEYDAFRNNCQDYIDLLILSNGLMTHNLRAFIKQDVSSLVQGMPGYIPSMAKSLTDLAARLRILIGQGKRRKNKL